MQKMTELGKKIDGAKLRNFAGKFVTGIAVITARAGDGIGFGHRQYFRESVIACAA